MVTSISTSLENGTQETVRPGIKVNEETGKALLGKLSIMEVEKPVYAIIVDGVSDHGARYEEL